jgi:hypothetical protein
MSESKLEQSPRSERRFVSRLLSEGSVVLAIITTILFLTGWSYLEAYYGFFGLDVITLDLPFYASLLGSVNPVLELFARLTELSQTWLFRTLFAVGCLTFFFVMIRREFVVRRLKGKILTKVQGWSPKLFAWFSASEIDPPGIQIVGQPRPPQPPQPPLTDRILRRGWSFFLAILANFCVLTILCLWVIGYTQGQKEGERYYQHPSTRVRLSFKREESQLFDPELVAASRDGSLMLLVQTKDLIVAFVKGKGQKVGDGVFIVPRANLLSVHNEPIRYAKR